MPSEVILATLRQIWTCLEQVQIPTALMGGLALSVWQHPRATRDVDLLVSLGHCDIETLLQTFRQKGFHSKRDPAVLTLGRLRIVQLLYQPPGTFVDLQVDLLLADCDYQREALARRVPTRLPGLETPLFVLSCEDLILHKLIAGRILDRADVIALVRANRDTLDTDYIQLQGDRLQITADWNEAFQEATRE